MASETAISRSAAGFIQRVADERRAHVVSARAHRSAAELRAERRASVRPLIAAIEEQRTRGRFAVIAELARTSPTLGELSSNVDMPALAREYAGAGAAAISVVTEPKHWGGSLEDLRRVREAVDVPVLCKDIIVDAYQLAEAYAAGADAVLLVAEALDDEDQMRQLVTDARELGMEPLMEAHDIVPFSRAAACGATIIASNARNPRYPMKVDPNRAWLLAPLVQPGQLYVADSPIRSTSDAAMLPPRVHAVVVGSAPSGSGQVRHLVREIANVSRPLAPASRWAPSQPPREAS